MSFYTNKLFVVTVLVANFIVTSYINLRQYFKLSSPITPAAKKVYTEEKFSLSCKYNKERLAFSISVQLYDLFITIGYIYVLEKAYTFFTSNICKYDEIFLSIYFFTFNILHIPFNLYSDFVIESKYGFNKKTLKLFVRDFIISSALNFAFSIPVMFIVKYLINNFPNFPFYVTGFTILLNIFMIIIYPRFITPLFYKVSSLEEGELKDRVNKLAGDINFTIDKIEVIDGSVRSSHSNAYFVGIFKAKRIVFFDTLLKQMSNDEILAVLCHELGHWYYNHILINMSLSTVQTFIYMFMVKICMGNKVEFKFDQKTVMFTIIVSSLSLPLSFLFKSLSRLFEKQADSFAVRKGYGKHLISGLMKLHTENMSAPIVDWLYSAIGYSHPHITERIECIENEMNKNE